MIGGSEIVEVLQINDFMKIYLMVSAFVRELE